MGVDMSTVIFDFTNMDTDLVVLVDISDTRSYNNYQLTSLNSVLCHYSYFRSIVAHSSGSGSFLPAKSISHRSLNSYYEANPKINYVPFVDTQAATFLCVNSPKVDHVPDSELKSLTGFNPSLMVAYVSAAEKEYVNQIVTRKVRSFIDSIVPTLKEDNFFWVNEILPVCQKFFYYATNECDIPIRDLDEYLTSWINTESITYILEKTTEKFKLAVNFPPAIHLLMSVFRKCKSQSGFNSAIVDGLVFEEAICRKIETLCIKYSKTDNDLKSVRFTISAHSVKTTALQEIYPGILYHLRDFHPTIDAVGCFTVEENAKWLVMIQISLSTYSKHKSKAADLFNKTVGSEKTNDSCSLLDYYRNRIRDVTDSKKFTNPEVIKCMYVYISPDEFFVQTNPSEILGDVGIHSRTKDKDLYFGLVHEHSDTGRFITDTRAEL